MINQVYSSISVISFLKEVETSAALTANDVRKSYLPIISIVPGVSECSSTNFPSLSWTEVQHVESLSAYGVRQYMKSQKRRKAVEVIDMWNRVCLTFNSPFFEPLIFYSVLFRIAKCTRYAFARTDAVVDGSTGPVFSQTSASYLEPLSNYRVLE